MRAASLPRVRAVPERADLLEVEDAVRDVVQRAARGEGRLAVRRLAQLERLGELGGRRLRAAGEAAREVDDGVDALEREG